MSGTIVLVNDSNFDSEVLQSNKPVMVDFSAVWCGPCQRQYPILQDFAKKNPSVKVCKVDIDESPGVTSKIGIRNVPTIILFNNGKVVQTKVGVNPVAAIETMVQLTINE